MVKLTLSPVVPNPQPVQIKLKQESYDGAPVEVVACLPGGKQVPLIYLYADGSFTTVELELANVNALTEVGFKVNKNRVLTHRYPSRNKDD